jgi:hypothetical protein
MTSFLAVFCFTVGYLIPWRSRKREWISSRTLAGCESLAYSLTVILAPIAVLVAAQYLYSVRGIPYGFEGPTPFWTQAVLYAHLFFGFLYLGVADPKVNGYRPILIGSFLTILPRLIVTLHGGRFFLVQGIVPLLLIATARGWIRLTTKRVAQFAALMIAIILVPSLIRGYQFTGQEAVVEFFQNGSNLRLYQDNTDLSLTGYCPPLLVSLTAKTIPYSLLDVCVMRYGGRDKMPATDSRILTVNEPGTYGGTAGGTGSNFMLELYLTGGIPLIVLGSIAFGFSCRRFIDWIAIRSVFAGIWAECLTRAIFAPRGELGYVYERIPSLVLTTFLFIIVVRAAGEVNRRFGHSKIQGTVSTQES